MTKPLGASRPANPSELGDVTRFGEPENIVRGDASTGGSPILNVCTPGGADLPCPDLVGDILRLEEEEEVVRCECILSRGSLSGTGTIAYCDRTDVAPGDGCGNSK